MSKHQIPAEYQDFDFGFTAVDTDDAAPAPQPVVQQIDTDQISAPILQRIEEIYTVAKRGLDKLEQLDQVLSASVKDIDQDEYMAAMRLEYQDKLKQVEEMIIPLLVNLMKNPEKDYIKWANRKPIIESQIQKILDITRGG